MLQMLKNLVVTLLNSLGEMAETVITFLFDWDAYRELFLWLLERSYELLILILPATMDTYLASFATAVTSAPVVTGGRLAFWYMDQFMHASFVMSLVSFWFLSWPVFAGLRWVIWVKRIFWPG